MGSDKTMPEFRQYEVIGRHVPTERDPEPKAYRIKLFTRNETQARSRFWYFIRRLVKMKKANAEILSLREIFEKKPDKVSKYGIWLRYDSRSGTTNMYKEFSALTQNAAVQAMYQEMAGRHRARFSSIHIIKCVEIEAKACARTSSSSSRRTSPSRSPTACPAPTRRVSTRAPRPSSPAPSSSRSPCNLMRNFGNKGTVAEK